MPATAEVRTDLLGGLLRLRSRCAPLPGRGRQGADLGAQGRDAYDGGLARGDLAITRREAERAVRAYLRDSGAQQDHPGLRAVVRVEDHRVVVELVAPVDLPLGVPGLPAATVRSVGSAVVDPDE